MKWIPLESNPDVMNKFIREIGVPKTWGFVDVYGVDNDIIAMIPKPTIALLLLYPLSDKVVKNEIGTVCSDENCFYIKQTISNACGTIAILHALANSNGMLNLNSMQWLKDFIEKTQNSTPNQRAESLELDMTVSEMHEECALQGETQVPDAETPINLHFVAFVNSNDRLLEMDGRRGSPIFHGSTSKDTFLFDAVSVVKQFMKRDPDELNFCLVALTEVAS